MTSWETIEKLAISRCSGVVSPKILEIRSRIKSLEKYLEKYPGASTTEIELQELRNQVTKLTSE